MDHTTEQTVNSSYSRTKDGIIGTSLNRGAVPRLLLQEFYAEKGPFTKQIATEGFSRVFGQLMSPL